MKQFIITIDGSAGSGKSTVAKLVSKRFGFFYLDAGALYRMITLKHLESGLKLDEDSLNEVELQVKEGKFYLDEVDVSLELRSREVSNKVAEVARNKHVRKKILDFERSIAQGRQVIMEGRDIGTVVFPNADVKFFFKSDPEVRAKRRFNDYQKKGINLTFNEILNDIKKRDELDIKRKESPLIKAKDAIEIDTSELSTKLVCEKVSEIIRKSLSDSSNIQN